MNMRFFCCNFCQLRLRSYEGKSVLKAAFCTSQVDLDRENGKFFNFQFIRFLFRNNHHETWILRNSNRILSGEASLADSMQSRS